MQDKDKTKKQLIEELERYRQKVLIIETELANTKEIEEEHQKNISLLSKRNRYQEIINSVTRVVHHSISLQEVIDGSVEALRNNIQGVDCVAVYLVEGDVAVMKGQKGYPEDVLDRLSKIPYPKGFTWKTIIEDKPLYVPDTDKDETMGPAGKAMGTQSYASIPIHNDGKAFGAITINSLFKKAFDQEELNLLRIIARQIVIAINNAKRAEDLEKSNEELQIFAYVASHDLQEPLRMIGSYLGLLERRYKDKLDSDAKEFIDFAVDGAKRMQVLINDLLAYSRLSTKGKPFETVLFKDLINNVLKNLEMAIKDVDAEIVLTDLPELIRFKLVS